MSCLCTVTQDAYPEKETTSLHTCIRTCTHTVSTDLLHKHSCMHKSQAQSHAQKRKQQLTRSLTNFESHSSFVPHCCAFTLTCSLVNASHAWTTSMCPFSTQCKSDECLTKIRAYKCTHEHTTPKFVFMRTSTNTKHKRYRPSEYFLWCFIIVNSVGIQQYSTDPFYTETDLARIRVLVYQFLGVVIPPFILQCNIIDFFYIFLFHACQLLYIFR